MPPAAAHVGEIRASDDPRVPVPAANTSASSNCEATTPKSGFQEAEAAGLDVLQYRQEYFCLGPSVRISTRSDSYTTYSSPVESETPLPFINTHIQPCSLSFSKVIVGSPM